MRFFLFLESVVFPLAFLLLAAMLVWDFVKPLERPIAGKDTRLGAVGVLIDLLANPDKLAAGESKVQLYAVVANWLIRPALILVFNILCAAFIAFRTRLSYTPATIREVLVPIAGTTIIFLVPLAELLPDWVGRQLRYPPAWVLPVSVAGAVIATVGILVAIYGLLYLRRNFSVFVEVREVVLTGPYRFVRHPLYIGEILMVAGIVLSSPSVFRIAIFVALVLFQIWRAKMEESHLAAASPEYAARMKVTGMFLPRFGRA